MPYSQFKLEADSYVKSWGEEINTCPPSEIPLLIALTFSSEYIDIAKRMANFWIQKFLKPQVLDFRGYGSFTYLLNFGSTLHLFGENQESLLHAILKSKPPEEKNCKAQYKLLQFYINKNYPLIEPSTKKNISFYTLHKKVGEVSVDSLYEFLLNPDIDGWHEKAQPYFQLVALLYYQSKGISNQKDILNKLKEDFTKAKY